VRKDLTRRLQNVCAKLSCAKFEALIVQMTREQLRGEGIPGRSDPSTLRDSRAKE
jgi:hypothetical protein